MKKFNPRNLLLGTALFASILSNASFGACEYNSYSDFIHSSSIGHLIITCSQFSNIDACLARDYDGISVVIATVNGFPHYFTNENVVCIPQRRRERTLDEIRRIPQDPSVQPQITPPAPAPSSAEQVPAVPRVTLRAPWAGVPQTNRTRYLLHRLTLDAGTFSGISPESYGLFGLSISEIFQGEIADAHGRGGWIFHGQGVLMGGREFGGEHAWGVGFLSSADVGRTSQMNGSGFYYGARVSNDVTQYFPDSAETRLGSSVLGRILATVGFAYRNDRAVLIIAPAAGFTISQGSQFRLPYGPHVSNFDTRGPAANAGLIARFEIPEFEVILQSLLSSHVGSGSSHFITNVDNRLMINIGHMTIPLQVMFYFDHQLHVLEDSTQQEATFGALFGISLDRECTGRRCLPASRF